MSEQAPTTQGPTKVGNFHGGQSWRDLPNFVDDMSVTTNALGPPASAMKAAIDSMQYINHYPDQAATECIKALAEFCQCPPDHLLMGNGASELIDLAMRVCDGPFRRGPYKAQYSEYARAASLRGFETIEWDDMEHKAGVTVLIRPNSPTGDFFDITEVEKFLQEREGILMIDESFLPFYGPDWLEQSSIHLVDKYPNRLIIIQSWTKIWSCPGIRLGSACASPEIIRKMSHIQVPWSCSLIAQAFTVAAVKDREYLEKTWNKVRRWKILITWQLNEVNKSLAAVGFKTRLQPNPNSPHWVPWLFVNVGHEEFAEIANEVALKCGVPIRWCKDHHMPDCIRLGIRPPACHEILFDAIQKELMRIGPSRVGGGASPSSQTTPEADTKKETK